MKNITLSAEEHLIEKARRLAKSRNSTLNAEFRRWLEQYASTDDDANRRVQRYLGLMQDLQDVCTGGQKFTREEMNER